MSKEDLKEFACFVLIFALIFFLLWVLIFLSHHIYGHYQCHNFSEITGKETKWAAFDSCYIKEKDTWMRWDEYKVRNIASEGLKR